MKQEAGESPNDRNDRAIRVAAAWYTKRLPGHKVRAGAGWGERPRPLAVRVPTPAAWGSAAAVRLLLGYAQPLHSCIAAAIAPDPGRLLPCRSPQVILLSDDADNRAKAAELRVQALSSAAYARQRAAEGQSELQVGGEWASCRRGGAIIPGLVGML